MATWACAGPAQRALRAPALAAASVAALSEAVRTDADPYVRGWSARSLRSVPSPGAGALAALRAALLDTAIYPRMQAAAVLLRLTPEAPEPAAVIIAAVAVEDRDAIRLVGRLGSRGRPAVPALAALAGKDKLENGFLHPSWFAVHALAELGPEASAAIPALIAKLGEDWANPEWTVTTTGYLTPHDCPVGVALARIGKAALPDLQKTVREAKDAKQRLNAVLALGFMGPAAQEALPGLESLLKERLDPKRKPQREDEKLRTALRLAIANIRKPDARPPEVRAEDD